MSFEIDVSLDIATTVAEAAARGAAADHAAAIELLSRAIAAEPDSALLWAFRGRMWRLAGRVDHASSDLQRARSLDPEDPYSIAQWSWVLWVRGERMAAKATLRRLAERRPTYHWASAYLAHQHLVTAQLRAAERAVARALAAAPGCTYSRRIHADLLANRGQHRRALAILDALLTVSAEASVYAERGLVLAHLGDDAAATESLDHAIAWLPSARHFRRDRAAVNILAGNLARALADCAAAVEVSPEREPYLHYRIAQLHTHLSDPRAARRALRRARGSMPAAALAARSGTLASPRWTRDALLARVGIMEPPGTPLA